MIPIVLNSSLLTVIHEFMGMDEELLVKVKLECLKIAAEAQVPHAHSVNPEDITDYAKVLSDWVFDPRNAFDYKMQS